jgi:hypothetical protein
MSTPDVCFPRFFSEWHYAILFCVLQYTSGVTVVPCYMNSTIRTPFLSQKIAVISFLAGRQRLFKIFGFLVNVCASTALTAPCFLPSEMKLRFYNVLLIRCN